MPSEDDIYHDPLPPRARALWGKSTGPLLIVGPGWSVKADLKRLGAFKGEKMAVNAAGMWVPRISHWYTSHGDWLAAWRLVRSLNFQKKNPDAPFITHTKQGKGGADIEWPLAGRYTYTSGMAAAVLGIELGFAPIVLAGLPADDGGHCYPELGHRDDFDDYGQETHLDKWRWLHRNLFKGRVKSLSGNTREILGEP